MHPFRRHLWHILSTDLGPSFTPRTTVHAVCQRPGCKKQRRWFVRNVNLSVDMARQRFPRKTWR